MIQFMMLPVFADESGEKLFSEQYWVAFLHSAVFGLLGIALMLLAMKIFDWISPRIDVQTELVEKKNMPVAVVVAAIVAGVSYIVGIAIH
jgi:amino acid transporter